VLEGPSDILIEQALKFDFKTSNNQPEYEAIVVGLDLALGMEAKKLVCRRRLSAPCRATKKRI